MIAKTDNIHVDHIKSKIDSLISELSVDHVQLVKMIKAIVPEYISNNSEFEKLDDTEVKVKKLKIGWSGYFWSEKISKKDGFEAIFFIF